MSTRYGYETNETGITLTDRYDSVEGTEIVPQTWKGKTVTAIGEELFRGEKNLSEIVFPATVTSLGWWALRDCVSLHTVRFTGPLKEIGYRAFSGCTSLKTVDLPESVEHIGEAAFWGCSGLKRITLPPKITTLRNRTFYGCRHLTDILMPPHLQTIEWGSFEHCSSLRSLTVPSEVKKIGSNALRGCSGLKELNLSDKTEAISENLFGHRELPPLEKGYIPNTDPEQWGEEAAKILALCYLTTIEQHHTEEQRKYNKYIGEHSEEIIALAIRIADLAALEGLYRLGYPEENHIEDCIETANANRCRDVVVSLMEYRHRHFARLSVEEQLQTEFSLDHLFQ